MRHLDIRLWLYVGLLAITLVMLLRLYELPADDLARPFLAWLDTLKPHPAPGTPGPDTPPVLPVPSPQPHGHHRSKPDRR